MKKGAELLHLMFIKSMSGTYLCIYWDSIFQVLYSCAAVKHCRAFTEHALGGISLP